MLDCMTLTNLQSYYFIICVRNLDNFKTGGIEYVFVCAVKFVRQSRLVILFWIAFPMLVYLFTSRVACGHSLTGHGKDHTLYGAYHTHVQTFVPDSQHLPVTLLGNASCPFAKSIACIKT